MSEVKEIKQSINKIQVVGTLAEINLEETTKEVELRNGNTTKTVTCKSIGKKDFRNPSILIEVSPKDEDGNVRYTSNVGLSFYPTYEMKLDEKGKPVENPRFKALQTIMNDYVTKAQDRDNATRVKADGSLTANEYATSKDGKNYEFVSFPQLNCFQVTSTNVPIEDSCDGEISGIIRTIKPEIIVRNDEEEETGRLLVELYSFDRNGATTPTKFVVDKDLAEDFSDIYENGTSCQVYYEVVTKTVGGKKSTKRAFGSRDAHITSGFEVTEYSIFSGNEPFEEESEYFVDTSLMKQAMETRQDYIDSKIADKKKADTEGKKGTATKKTGLGNRSPKIDNQPIDESLEDCPF